MRSCIAELEEEHPWLSVFPKIFANKVSVHKRSIGQHHTFGIDLGALTANEARDLSGFLTADELRSRAAKAAEEINLRLRAKGFQRKAPGISLQECFFPVLAVPINPEGRVIAQRHTVVRGEA